MDHTVYLITNEVNGKNYVGQSRDWRRRWRGHQSDARRGVRHPLYHAMRKHGIDYFHCFPIVSVPTKEEADYQEHMWIILMSAHTTRDGYTCSWKGDGRQGLDEESLKRKAQTYSNTIKITPCRHPRWRQDITTDEIVRLSLDEQMTAREIAHRFGCSRELVKQRLKRAGVTIGRGRHRSGIPLSDSTKAKMKGRVPINYRKDIENSRVVSMYNSGLSSREIASMLGCSSLLVLSRLRSNSSEARPIKRYMPSGLDDTNMRQLYENGKTLKELARMFNVAPGSIKRRVLLAGGSMRPSNNIPRKFVA